MLNDMRPVPTAQRLIRAAFTALFGVMSLAHGPVMAAAHDTGHHPPAIERAAAPMHHAGHHHHEMDHAKDHMMPDPAEQPEAPASESTTCNSFACFLAVASPSVGAPAAAFILLGQLTAYPPRAGSPAVPEPADPPPRLQA
jgi:hypothetical protein